MDDIQKAAATAGVFVQHMGILMVVLGKWYCSYVADLENINRQYTRGLITPMEYGTKVAELLASYLLTIRDEQRFHRVERPTKPLDEETPEERARLPQY